MAYAELWWDRASERTDMVINQLIKMRWEIEECRDLSGYVVVENQRVEKALEEMSKQNNNVYLETDKLESKLEEIVDELRGLNGTMNMLTH